MAGELGGDAPAGDWPAAVKCEQPIGWRRAAARSDWLAGNTPGFHWLVGPPGPGRCGAARTRRSRRSPSAGRAGPAMAPAWIGRLCLLLLCLCGEAAAG